MIYFLSVAVGDVRSQSSNYDLSGDQTPAVGLAQVTILTYNMIEFILNLLKVYLMTKFHDLSFHISKDIVQKKPVYCWFGPFSARMNLQSTANQHHFQ